MLNPSIIHPNKCKAIITITNIIKLLYGIITKFRENTFEVFIRVKKHNLSSPIRAYF